MLLIRKGKLKHRILSAAIYGITALVLARFFDSLYGSGPVTQQLTAIHTAIVGAILFAFAFVVSLFALRLGVICGLAACILSWPCLGRDMVAIPWRNAIEILPYARWADIFAAILALTISSIFSLFNYYCCPGIPNLNWVFSDDASKKKGGFIGNRSDGHSRRSLVISFNLTRSAILGLARPMNAYLGFAVFRIVGRGGLGFCGLLRRSAHETIHGANQVTHFVSALLNHRVGART